MSVSPAVKNKEALGAGGRSRCVLVYKPNMIRLLDEESITRGKDVRTLKRTRRIIASLAVLIAFTQGIYR